MISKVRSLINQSENRKTGKYFSTRNPRPLKAQLFGTEAISLTVRQFGGLRRVPLNPFRVTTAPILGLEAAFGSIGLRAVFSIRVGKHTSAVGVRLHGPFGRYHVRASQPDHSASTIRFSVLRPFHALS